LYRVLIGKPEHKRPLGRPWRRLEDNIKMDLREIRIDGSNWIRLDQDRVQWWVHAMKAYWGSGGIVPRISDLGTTWR
jgi:hypothetical protein